METLLKRVRAGEFSGETKEKILFTYSGKTGLCLIFYPKNQTFSWVFRYNQPVSHNKRQITLGALDSSKIRESTASALEKYAEYFAIFKKGLDPKDFFEEEKNEKIRNAYTRKYITRTVADVARSYIDNVLSIAQIKSKNQQIKEIEKWLISDLTRFPSLKFSELTLEQVRKFKIEFINKIREIDESRVDKIKKDGSRYVRRNNSGDYLLNKLIGYLSKIIKEETKAGNVNFPFFPFGAELMQPEKERNRFLNDFELRKFFQFIYSDECRFSRSYKDILIVELFTGVRSINVVSLVWKNIDLENCVIKIDNTKNGLPILVHVSKPLREVLLFRKKAVGDSSEFVFPNPHYRDNFEENTKTTSPVLVPHIQEKSLSNTSNGISEFCKNNNMKKFSSHDLRRTFSNLVLDFSQDFLIQKLALGHKIKDVNIVHYSKKSTIFKMVSAEVEKVGNHFVDLGFRPGGEFKIDTGGRGKVPNLTSDG
ncbi:tyrosine-type recombinase/integrase [Chitinibacter sp. FCG-7]|uniref:Tyrosine-type recombinase/integrase n=1 Tax=Chitinibacter mangrovi TaxID=3153927 RepID=A0AAU7FA74_9NEIS